MQTKNKKRVNLFLDGRFTCGLEAITVVKYGLNVGMQLDDDKLQSICIDSETGTAFDRAIRYLGIRMHSQLEVEKYLTQKGYLPIVVNTVIEKLKDYKYIDDKEFAAQYVNSHKKKDGQHKLRYDLGMLGVDTDIVESVLKDLDSTKQIEYLLQKRYKGDKRKIIDYLIRRGFCYDDILPVLERFVQDIG